MGFKGHLKGWENKINPKLKYVNLRQIGGIILFVLGGTLVLIAIDAMRKIAKAKGLSHDISNFFEHNPGWNPIIKFFGGKAEQKISQYDLPVMLTLIAGSILLLFGAIIFVYYRNRIKTK